MLSISYRSAECMTMSGMYPPTEGHRKHSRTEGRREQMESERQREEKEAGSSFLLSLPSPFLCFVNRESV